jgi:hypothetical protein
MTRHSILAAVATIAAVVLPSAGLTAQRLATSPTNAAAAKTVPRTADGKPDMQGDWTNATYTPFERPDALKGKEFFTPEEAAAYAERRQAAAREQPIDTHYENAIWMTEKQLKGLSSLRTSIVVEPQDGKVPPVNAEGRRRAAERAAARKDVGPLDSVQAMELSDRCVYWLHEGPPIVPTGYNSNLRIVQAPQAFVVMPEMMPAARVVPLDGRPRIGKAIKTLRGDSRGWWEGDTMVVETTNFDERRDWRGTSDSLKVTERFTMVDPDTIRYEFTVDDPRTWDVAWKGEVALRRISEPVFEYACHEGNYGLPNILRGQRRAEAEAKGASR